MKIVTSICCIDLIKEKFPQLLPYWEAYVADFGSDLGLHIQMIPFGDYAIDIIKTNNDVEIKKIFDFVEFLICNGEEEVQNAITTSFLEYLMSKDPNEIQFSKFVKYLGKNTISYCRAWDEFTNIKTEGLWDNDIK